MKDNLFFKKNVKMTSAIREEGDEGGGGLRSVGGGDYGLFRSDAGTSSFPL